MSAQSVHEAKVSNSQYLIKEFQEFTGNQNTPRLFCVLRDRPQVLYISQNMGLCPPYYLNILEHKYFLDQKLTSLNVAAAQSHILADLGREVLKSKLSALLRRFKR